MISVNSLDRKNEIEDAFRKLQEYIYFENVDLYSRSQLVEYLNDNGIEKLTTLYNLLDKKVLENFSGYLNKIGLRYYPKKITNDLGGIEKNIPPNFISNAFIKNHSTLNRVSIFCDIPIELHIVSIIWILEFGYVLDKKMIKQSYGNRILFHKGKIGSNKTLFKPYVRQYQKWWSNGIQKTEELLNNDENATILNFDLKDYYHSVELDFDILEKELTKKFSTIRKDPIHILFKEIHEKYALELLKINHPNYTKKVNNKFPLPIGLLSSFILGNWHLRDFDKFILKSIIPSYYGRYVDDVFLVLKERLVTVFTDVQKNSLRKYFEKNNIIVNDLSDKTINTVNYFLYKYFNRLLVPFKTDEKSENVNYRLKLKGLENLVLQEEKVFIYQFDSKMSPHLISKFVEEQKERSSEFRFLSDQEDENFDDFNENTFESNFDDSDLNKAKFKNIEENKFKLSVYFAKFIQRRIERGEGYKDEEINKIEKYFKGIHLLRYYFFWEKLLTLYVVSTKHDKFIQLLKSIKEELKSLKIDVKLNISDDVIKIHLEKHLLYSIFMAVGYKPKFVNEQIMEYMDQNFSKIDFMYFRRKALLRKQYIYYPLLQLTSKGKQNDFSLIDYNIFNVMSWKSVEFEIGDIKFVPFKVKYYEAALFTHLKLLYTQTPKPDTNYKRWYNDIFKTQKVLNEAFSIFYKINNPQNSSKEFKVRNEYFQAFEINKSSDSINIRPKAVEVTELFFKNSGKTKNKYRVAIINKYIALKEFELSLTGSPLINKERVEIYNWILDQLNKIKELDLFVMPEVSLPHPLIKKFVNFSRTQQVGFVSGIEHLNVNNIGFNFIMTCLPINIDGDKDCVPILRLKNHYAPEEEEWIQGKYMVVPKPKPYRYDLFEWRGMYMSSYYCYELADIFHRSIFVSMVDLICAPVWNADTHYYNNIIESAARDMHCYFVQVNTSQYGDTRVTRPTDHIRKDRAKVKGGTVDDYKVTLLVSDIDVEKLRAFQNVAYSEQKKLNEDKKSFKPTPPDFDLEAVRKRINNERFGEIIS